MPNVNPEILQWARKTAGLTPEDAVKKLGISDARGVASIERLEALERGDDIPTRPMLVKMAKQYRRPLLSFYMPKVPRMGDRGEDFRTLAEPLELVEVGIIDAVVRDIRARQALVRASLEAADELETLPFIASMEQEHGVDAVVASIIETLGFSRQAFRGGGNQLRKSFGYLRQQAESAGIFVILVDNLGSWHTTINVDAFRGFALVDDVAPFVAVNANDSPAAWSFTLVHELAHLWIGATGVSGGNGGRAIEKFCNDVASELLLPQAEMDDISINEQLSFEKMVELIAEFAGERHISNTMVAYKLYRLGRISENKFQQLKNTYRDKFLERKAAEKKRNAEKNSGPAYHTVRKHRVGDTLIRFVERMMHDGNLSTTKAGKVLGVGPHNVFALIEQGRANHAV